MAMEIQLIEALYSKVMEFPDERMLWSSEVLRDGGNILPTSSIHCVFLWSDLMIYLGSAPISQEHVWHLYASGIWLTSLIINTTIFFSSDKSEMWNCERKPRLLP
jgi:hypothetical protein